MADKEIAFTEISKRIDYMEDDIIRLRDRAHEATSEQGCIVTNMKEMDITLTNMYENQKILSENVIEMTKRLSELEKGWMQINLVKSHWKMILGVIIISVIIGLAAENGLKNAIKALLPDKVLQAAKAVRSDG